ncbi:ABC transporter ATP-binding protein [Agarivorans sp. QJM3NY_33]|uniref:ABC transporter ATP-binding protein n=1 Tax=Agarivorans sp. QJM3NY_33 TaxID=3421432 RepID=UPI003D7D0811
MSSAIIQANNLWKEYGDNVVLERLNLQVMEGDFVSIVGASGCGKSTFLNLLLGNERVTRGELLLDGQPLPQEPSSERGIVFQKYSVFPHLTALQNVMLAEVFEHSGILVRLFGRAKQQAEQRAQAMLAKVGLAQAAQRYPAELSGGMQQRLAIAQALMKQPRILLLDEPFGALDPGIRKDMHQLIDQLWQERKLTIFMITHDLSEGFRLGNRLWVFDKHRHDAQHPERYGAQVTFDIPISKDNYSEALGNNLPMAAQTCFAK